MSVLDKVTVLRLLTASRRDAYRLAARWAAAGQREPELVADLVRLGGILELRPRVLGSDGVEAPDPIDPIRLAVDRGRAELAKELLALMGMTPFDLKLMMEESPYGSDQDPY